MGIGRVFFRVPWAVDGHPWERARIFDFGSGAGGFGLCLKSAMNPKSPGFFLGPVGGRGRFRAQKFRPVPISST